MRFTLTNSLTASASGEQRKVAVITEGLVASAKRYYEEEMGAMRARVQQAMQEAAGWQAAHEQSERHNVALQGAERENREAQATTFLNHAAELSRIAASEQHRARLVKGRAMEQARSQRPRTAWSP